MNFYNIILCLQVLNFMTVQSLKIIESNSKPCTAKIRNVQFQSENTICLKMKTFQFHQNYKNLTSKETPFQAVISIGPISIVTLQTIPENFFTQYVLVEQFKHGKTIFGVHPTHTNYYPSWTPNTWNSMCILLSESKIILYLNNEFVDELDNLLPVNQKYGMRKVQP